MTILIRAWCVCLCLVVPATWSSIIYVDADAGGSNTGADWTNAYNDLQDALDVASSGDEIWVAAGTYYPSVKSGGSDDRHKTFVLVDGVGLYGGFAGTESSRDERDWKANVTTLSGDIGTPDDISDNVFHVINLYPINVSSDGSRLDGFTITGGNGTSGNTTDQQGGGIHLANDRLVIANCTFTANRASEGGAIYSTDAFPQIVNCTLLSNTSTGNGGAIYNYIGFTRIQNCWFEGNMASSLGGAFYTLSNDLEVANCVFTENTASSAGGAIFNDADGIFINCVIYGNVATFGGAMLGNTEAYTNCIIWDNGTNSIMLDAGTITHSIVEGGRVGTGNLSQDPLFVDPDNGDFRLQRGSPAIGAGSNAVLPADVADLDGDGDTSEDLPVDLDGDRRVRGTVDMGAYEYTRIWYVDASQDGLEDGTSWDDAFLDLQDALDVATSGDEIWVADGTYKPSVEEGGSGDRYATFLLVDGVGIYGGFAGDETNRAARDWETNATILSGDIGIVGDDSDNSYHVITSYVYGLEATLDGVTITKGNADASGNYSYGGALYLTNSSSTFRNVTFIDNAAGPLGGAVYTSGLSPVFDTCTFSGNTAFSGAGLFNHSGSPLIKDCLFEDNSGTTGAGIQQSSSTGTMTVVNTIFRNNTATSYGAGAFMNGGDIDLVNCLFYDNPASDFGTVTFHNSANSRIINSTIADNPDGLYLRNSDLAIANSILWDNNDDIYINTGDAPTITNSVVSDGDSGTNVITSDPLFVDSENGDYRLTLLSPAIGVGDNTDLPTDTADLDDDGDTAETLPLDLLGHSRIQDTTVNLGPYETTIYLGPIFYVDATATDGGNGSDWTHAFNDLQDALEIAQDGDEIWVAAGTYKPTVQVGGSGDRYATFQMINGVGIYGGFAGTETARDERDWETNVTILSGDIGTTDYTPDNVYHVIRNGAALSTSALLNGFTVTGGVADSSDEDSTGGGMLNDDTAFPTIANCIFEYNTAIGNGGGINGGGPTVSNCTFRYNESTTFHGGGFRATAASSVSDSLFEFNVSHFSGGGMISSQLLQMTNTIFRENTAGDTGGGLYATNFAISGCLFDTNTSGAHGGGLQAIGSTGFIRNTIFRGNSAVNGGGLNLRNGGDPKVYNCTFIGNTADTDGGGLYAYQVSDAIITNCVIADNTAGQFGGGMHVSSGADITFVNCTFTGNSATQDGDGLSLHAASFPTLTNCIFWNNGVEIANIIGNATVNYSLVEGGYTGTSNLDVDPLFVDADNGDYRLFSSSPAIDSGDNTQLPADTADLDGDSNTTEAVPLDLNGSPRVQNSIVNLGATEDTVYDGPIFYVDATATDGGNGSDWTHAFNDLQDALEVAQDGDEIWVAAGTYKPTSGTDRTVSFYLLNGVGIYGGFAGTETARNQRDWETNLTILSGDIGTAAYTPDNSHHVFSSPTLLDATAVLDGVTIRDGHADGPGQTASGQGGGMYLSSPSGNGTPTISNCTFSNNIAQGVGGAIAFGGLTLTNCTFQANTSGDQGGAIYMSASTQVINCSFEENSALGGGAIATRDFGGDVIISGTTFHRNQATDSAGAGGGAFFTYPGYSISDCVFTENTSAATGGAIRSAAPPNQDQAIRNSTFRDNTGSQGGAIHVSNGALKMVNCHFNGNNATGGSGGGALAFVDPASPPVVINSEFIDNMADSSGGAVYSNKVSGEFINCLFSGNQATVNGGAVFNTRGAATVLTNCSFSQNSATAGGAIYNHFLSNAVITNSILWGNGDEIVNVLNSNPVVTYSIVEGGYTGTGNLDADPLFVDPDNHDLRLQAASRAVNAGDSGALPADTTDLDGDSDTAEDLPLDFAGNRRVKGSSLDMGAYEKDVLELQLANDTPYESESTTGTVTRDADDMSGALVVSLSSASSTDASLPATLTIAADQMTATVTVTAVDDAIDEANIDVLLTASATGYANGTITPTILDNDPASFSVSLSPSTISEDDGPSASTGTVTRPLPHSTELTATLISNDTTEATVPPSVTFAAGSSTATFPIVAEDDAGVDDGDQNITIIAVADFYSEGFGALVVQDTDSSPVANADEFEFTLGTASLTVAAAGVLANDTDADGGPLTATVVSTTTNGALTLNSDGSFTWTPDSGTVFNDTFSYKTIDTAGNESSPASVLIRSNIIFVREGIIGGGNNGIDWVHAFTDLQDALDIAETGDEIWVAAGTYRPTAELGGSGERFRTFQATGTIPIYGGFGGGETSLDERDWESNVTILSGDVDADDYSPDNAYHVITYDNPGETLTLDGLTVTGGYAEGSSHYDGGGLLLRGGDAIIRNTSFTGNYAADEGGGIYTDAGSTVSIFDSNFSDNRGGGAVHGAVPTVADSTFSHNGAFNSSGGAIHFRYGYTATVTNSTFSDNQSNSDGGGIYSGAILILRGCTFTDNVSGYYGGAVVGDSQLTVIDSTFLRNQSADYAGAIGVDGVSEPVTIVGCRFLYNEALDGDGGAIDMDYSDGHLHVENTLFAHNIAHNDEGGAIDYYEGSVSLINCTFAYNESDFGAVTLNCDDVQIENCLFWQNAGSDRNGDIDGIRDVSVLRNTLLEHEIDAGTLAGIDHANLVFGQDPLLFDPLNDDFRLIVGSPAIDTADNAALPVDLYDLDNDDNTAESLPIDVNGSPRIQFGVVNMGAVEDTVYLGPIFHVDHLAADGGDGSTWTRAFNDLQDALAVAEDGDEIWIATGTYYPTDGTDTGVSFAVNDGVTVLGGFAGYEDTAEGRDWQANTTTLSGDIGTPDWSQDNSEVVVEFATYQGPIGVTFDGLTITDAVDAGMLVEWPNTMTMTRCAIVDNHGPHGIELASQAHATITDSLFSGNATNSAVGSGVGLHVGFQSSALVERCDFIGNISGSNSGGAITAGFQSQLTLRDSLLQGNSANWGGALNCSQNSSVTVADCDFVDNVATNGGGAIQTLSSSTIYVANSRFHGNEATEDGGAVYVGAYTIDPVFVNSVFSDNTAGDQGGAGYHPSGADPDYVNCVFYANTGGEGGALYTSYPANASVTNSILWGNSPSQLVNSFLAPLTISDSIVEGGWTGDNITDADPLLVDPANGDFRLLAGSPALNAGLTSHLPADSADLDGDSNTAESVPLDLAGGTRVNGDSVDIGAYELATLALAGGPYIEGGIGVGTVSRDVVALMPEVIVSLSSSATSEATVPATVTIPENTSTATFTVTTLDDGDDTPDTLVTLSASADTYLSGAHTITITDNDPATLSVSINPDIVQEDDGNNATSGIVFRSEPLSVDLIVSLTSDDTSEATVPANVTILAGSSSATFPITAVDDGGVDDGDQTVTITASAEFYEDGTDTLEVEDTDSSPVANDDEFDFTIGNQLVVAAAGVLANDTDADGGPLTATVVSTATNGTLSLASDGAFTWTPDSSEIFTDSFTYKTTDAAGNESSPATVYLRSNILFVDVDAIGFNDGRDWTHAFNDLQDALAFFEPGDEIWVAEGTYLPSSTDDDTEVFALIDEMALYGGFSGTETARDQRDWDAHVTILSGDIGSQGFTPDNSETIVRMNVAEDTATLDGFTITGAIDCAVYLDEVTELFLANSNLRDNGNPQGRPGALFVDDDAQVIVENCTFLRNASQSRGGAVFVDQNGYAMFSDCTFTNNTAFTSGGAVYANPSAECDFVRCNFTNNRSLISFGGAFFNDNGVTTMVNCRFDSNDAKFSGAVYNGEEATFINCAFYANTSTNYGSAIYNDLGATVEVINCTFHDNSSTEGGAIHTNSSTDLAVTNSILWQNAPNEIVLDGSTIVATVSHSIVSGGWTGANNLDADPRFKDPDNGDLRLNFGTPAQNAADQSAIPADVADLDGDGNTVEPLPFDLDGQPRNQEGGVDIGAYEGPAVWHVDIDAGGGGNGPDAEGLVSTSSVANGGDWPTAYTSLQQALAVSLAGDEIWVAGGFYESYVSDPTDSFDIPAGVAVYGHFAGDEDARDERTFEGDATFLVGNGGGGNSEHVVTVGPGATGAQLHDLTVLGGSGGTHGGGVHVDNGEVALVNVNLFAGSAMLGGALGVINGGTATIVNGALAGNDAATDGSAIYTAGSLTLVNVDVSGNPVDASVLFIDGAVSTTIINTTFTENYSNGLSTAVIKVDAADDVQLLNSIVYGNAGAPAIVEHNNPTITVANSVIEGGYAGVNNTDDDPALDGGHQLTGTSSAIGRGNNAFLPVDIYDVDRDGDTAETIDIDFNHDPRIVDINVDAGAYELQNNPPVALPDEWTIGSDNLLTVSAAGVLANDTDLDGDQLTATVDTDVANGALSLNSDGSFTYFPDDGWFGTDSFTYTVTDGIASDTGIVTLNVEFIDRKLSIEDETIVETDGPLTFTVTLSETSGRDVSADWSLVEVSATADTDYTDASGSVTVTAGQLTSTIVVGILEDTTDEFDQTFTVQLTNAARATFGDDAATGTIVDNDEPPTVSLTGDSTVEGGSLTFTATLSEYSEKPISLDYATSNDTTEPADYTADSGSWSFAVGETAKAVVIQSIDDAVDEYEEQFRVTLSNPVNVTIDTGEATGVLIDNDDPPNMRIYDTSVDGIEGTIHVHAVVLDGPSEKIITVDYQTVQNGTAGAGDFVPTSGTLTFGEYVLWQQTAVRTIEDDLDEYDETYSVELSNPVDVVLTNTVGVATIHDDDEPPVLSVADQTASEGDSLVFTVSLDRASGKSITVDYATVLDGDASEADLTPASGSLSFSPGSTAKTFAVASTEDALDEVDETFSVTLSSPVNSFLGSSAASGTILDDDPLPTLSVSANPVVEGEQMTVTVTLDAPTSKPVSVRLDALLDGTADSGDLLANQGADLSFAPGETSRIIYLRALDDQLDEADETFTIRLTNAVNADLPAGDLTGTIVDDDQPLISVNDLSLNEGDSGSRTVTFFVRLAPRSTRTIEVTYTTVDGTATAGADYQPRSGVLTFSPTNALQTIAVSVLGDELDEHDETFTLQLSNATIAVEPEVDFINTSATCTIVDDDRQPTLTVADTAVDEGSGSATLSFSLDAPSGRTISIDYATADQSAAAGADYGARSGTLSLAAGQTFGTVSFAILEDDLHEQTERFAVDLTADWAELPNSQAVVAIRDNETPRSLVYRLGVVGTGYRDGLYGNVRNIRRAYLVIDPDRGLATALYQLRHRGDTFGIIQEWTGDGVAVGFPADGQGNGTQILASLGLTGQVSAYRNQHLIGDTLFANEAIGNGEQLPVSRRFSGTASFGTSGFGPIGTAATTTVDSFELLQLRYHARYHRHLTRDLNGQDLTFDDIVATLAEQLGLDESAVITPTAVSSESTAALPSRLVYRHTWQAVEEAAGSQAATRYRGYLLIDNDTNSSLLVLAWAANRQRHYQIIDLAREIPFYQRVGTTGVIASMLPTEAYQDRPDQLTNRLWSGRIVPLRLGNNLTVELPRVLQGHQLLLTLGDTPADDAVQHGRSRLILNLPATREANSKDLTMEQMLDNVRDHLHRRGYQDTTSR